MVSDSAHVLVELHRRGPQPQDLGAVMLDDLFRLDGVAERLVHGAAFAIEHPAVQRAGAIRRAALQPHAHQQRTVEPAAILVAAFEVEIGRPGQVGSLA